MISLYTLTNTDILGKRIKKNLLSKVSVRMVGSEGLEPSRDYLPTDFKSVASAYSAMTPSKMEVPTGFEPVITELQSIALPLGYGTNCSIIICFLNFFCKHFCKKKVPKI